jgi:hypothetical protein
MRLADLPHLLRADELYRGDGATSSTLKGFDVDDKRPSGTMNDVGFSDAIAGGAGSDERGGLRAVGRGPGTGWHRRSLMPAAVKEQLVIHLHTQAEWRAEKSAEDPDDAPSIERLRALADYVEALPSDDPHIRALQAIHESYGLDVFSPGSEGRQLIARYGFQADETPEAFLDELVTAESADAVDRGHEEGDTW